MNLQGHRYNWPSIRSLLSAAIMQVLLLTRDKKIHALIGKAAAHAGHGCKLFSQTEEMQEVLKAQGGDVLIMDADNASASLMAWIRAHLPATFPVIACVAPTANNIVLELQQQGLTDYLVKPLRQGEVALRLRVALQRAYPDRCDPAPLLFGDYAFDETRHLLSIKAQPVELTQKEFALALLFFRHLNRPLSRAFIVEKIWSRELEVSSRTVDTHVSRVRTKLGLRPDKGFRLLPVYSFGYRLEQLETPAPS